MTGAGQLRERVRFQARGPDENGDPLGDWKPGFAVAARVRPLRGSEPVLQERLKGVQPYEITVRASTLTRELTTSHRAMWNGRALNIRTATPSEDRRFVIILADADGSDE